MGHPHYALQGDWMHRKGATRTILGNYFYQKQVGNDFIIVIKLYYADFISLVIIWTHFLRLINENVGHRSSPRVARWQLASTMWQGPDSPWHKLYDFGIAIVKIKSTIISKLGHYHLDDVWYFEIHVQKYIFRMKKSSFAKLLNPKEKLLIVLLLHHYCLEPKFVCAYVCLV